MGIVRLTIHQAKELDYSRSRSVDINPYAQLGFSSSTIHQTPSVKRSLSPIWESTTEFLVTDLSASIVTLKVLDSGDVLTDVQLGYMAVTLNDLLEACIEGREWFPLSSCKSGKVRMSLEWKPLEMAVTMKGSAAYVPPIGVIQLWWVESLRLCLLILLRWNRELKCHFWFTQDRSGRGYQECRLSFRWQGTRLFSKSLTKSHSVDL